MRRLPLKLKTVSPSDPPRQVNQLLQVLQRLHPFNRPVVASPRSLSPIHQQDQRPRKTDLDHQLQLHLQLAIAFPRLRRRHPWCPRRNSPRLIHRIQVDCQSLSRSPHLRLRKPLRPLPNRCLRPIQMHNRVDFRLILAPVRHQVVGFLRLQIGLQTRR